MGVSDVFESRQHGIGISVKGFIFRQSVFGHSLPDKIGKPVEQLFFASSFVRPTLPQLFDYFLVCVSKRASAVHYRGSFIQFRKKTKEFHILCFLPHISCDKSITSDSGINCKNPFPIPKICMLPCESNQLIIKPYKNEKDPYLADHWTSVHS